MTRQQAIQYAQACRYAHANGQPNPPRPDGHKPGTITKNGTIIREGTQMDKSQYTQGIADITKQVNQAGIKMSMLMDLCDKIDDYFSEAKRVSPKAAVYADLFNYVWSELQNIESTLKRIK